MTFRFKLCLICLIFGLLACGGKDSQTPEPRLFVTSTPFPTSTPRPSPTAEQTGGLDMALTNAFTRVDGAMRIQYPADWFLETTGTAAQGEMTLGNTRSAQRGKLSSPTDFSMHLAWGPAPSFLSAAVAPDIDPQNLLSLLVAADDDAAIDFDTILTTFVGEQAAARVLGIHPTTPEQTLIYVVDFGDGVAGVFRFRTLGDLAEFESLIQNLIASARYGGPPAILQSDAASTPQLSLRHDGAVQGAIWTQDDSKILSWSVDGTARLWDAVTGTILSEFQASNQIRHAQFSQDERLVLTLAESGGVQVWDAASGEKIRSFEALGALVGFVLSPDEQYLAGLNLNFASNVSTVPLWDFETGTLLHTFRPGVGSTVSGVVWNTAATQFILYSTGAQATLWDIASKSPVMSFNHDAEIFGARWNADNSLAMTWSQDKNLHIWSIADKSLFMTLPHADSPPRGALWNRDETRILSWQQDRVARLWEADTGAALFSLDNPPTLGGAAWTADERSIFTWANPAGNSQLIRLWDADTGELRLSLPDQLMSGLDALSVDESHLLTWAFDGSLNLWELASQSAQMTWRHAGIQKAVWNHAQNQILSWSNDGTIHLWDASQRLIIPNDNLPDTPE